MLLVLMDFREDFLIRHVSIFAVDSRASVEECLESASEHLLHL